MGRVLDAHKLERVDEPGGRVVYRGVMDWQAMNLAWTLIGFCALLAFGISREWEKAWPTTEWPRTVLVCGLAAGGLAGGAAIARSARSRYHIVVGDGMLDVESPRESVRAPLSSLGDIRLSVSVWYHRRERRESWRVSVGLPDGRELVMYRGDAEGPAHEFAARLGRDAGRRVTVDPATQE